MTTLRWLVLLAQIVACLACGGPATHVGLTHLCFALYIAGDLLIRNHEARL